MEEFTAKLIEYIERRKPHIGILTPCYNSMCYTHYVSALLQTTQLCKQYGIQTTIEFCNTDSLIPRARNNMLAKSMSDRTITHFLFIDADIQWSPPDVLRLLLDDEMIIGGIYPKKQYAWKKMENTPNLYEHCIAKQQSHPNLQASPYEWFQNHLLEYNFHSTESTLTIEHNKMEVAHLPTGFMMIQRPVIETLQQAFPSTLYQDDMGYLHTEEEKKNAYALFDCSVENGQYMSEDWLFCERWRQLGGKIYANITIQLNHIGVHTFQGNFLRSII